LLYSSESQSESCVCIELAKRLYFAIELLDKR
jgi:hypothetical protein